MSIQAQINRINSAVTTQADKIAQIKTALEGKAAGGGGGASVETCAVTVTACSGKEANIDYYAVENGVAVAAQALVSDGQNSPLTISALRGSFVILSGNYSYSGIADSVVGVNGNVVRMVYDGSEGAMQALVFAIDADATTATITLT